MPTVKCHEKFLRERCQERGYSWEEVQGCIVSRDGSMLTIDPYHPDYPAKSRGSGPGDELSKILKFFGISAVEGCKCKGRARKMNEWGPDGCERRMDEIVGWLEEESVKRKLPFLRWPARVLVSVAIRRSRRSEKAARRT